MAAIQARSTHGSESDIPRATLRYTSELSSLVSVYFVITAIIKSSFPEGSPRTDRLGYQNFV